MNDAQTLEIYSRVLLFRDDALRDEFAFSRSLSPQQRRIVHLVAQKLGLEHGSVGEGESRQVIVYKVGCGPPRQPPALRHAASSIYGADAASPGGSPATLRGKKSLGDVRAYANGTLPARKSIGDLRGGYAAGASGSPRRGDSFFAPGPVPPLPSAAFNPVIGPPVSPIEPTPAALPFAVPEPSATIIRQPRGPDDTHGFRGRPSPDL